MEVVYLCQDTLLAEPLVLALRLRWPDLISHMASKASVGMQFIEQQETDLVILCENLVDLGIWQAITSIRRLSDIPIIFAIEGQEEMDVVKALQLGADGCINMPCNPMTALARVAAIIRRIALTGRRSDEGLIQCGDLTIDPPSYEVLLGENRLALTPTEFKLLYTLAKNRDKTLSQQFIHQAVWGYEVENNNTLKKYIQRLRRKLGDDADNPTWIKTIRGVGYRLRSPNSITPHVPATFMK